jgi:hypothetical protein
MADQDDKQDFWRAPGSGQYVYGKGLFQYKATRCYNISLEAIAPRESLKMLRELDLTLTTAFWLIDRSLRFGYIIWPAALRFILVSLTSGNSLPIERSIFRLPRNCVGTAPGDDVRGYQFFAVGQDCVRLDNPLVTLIAPNSFADAAVSLKTPRAHLRCGGVPADPLRNARHQVILHCHGLGRDDEVTLRRPLESNVVDFRSASLIDPFANSPFQPTQALIVAGRSVRRFAHALENPLTVLFHMNVGVAGLAGRRFVRRDDRRRPVLDCHVRREEADRIHVDTQLQAFVLCVYSGRLKLIEGSPIWIQGLSFFGPHPLNSVVDAPAPNRRSSNLHRGMYDDNWTLVQYQENARTRIGRPGDRGLQRHVRDAGQPKSRARRELSVHGARKRKRRRMGILVSLFKYQ